MLKEGEVRRLVATMARATSTATRPQPLSLSVSRRLPDFDPVPRLHIMND